MPDQKLCVETEFVIDFPSNPKFNVDMKSCGRDDIKTEFYLVNTNTSWLKQNFKFVIDFPSNPILLEM